VKNLFAALLFGLLLFTASPYAGARPAPVITSDRQYFDAANGLYILTGRVCVAAAHRVITADEARVDIAGLQVWARGNVTLKQDDIIFTGDSLYVTGGKHTAEITGNLCFSRANLSITADYAVYNWKTKIASLTGRVMLRRGGGEAQIFQALSYNVKTGQLVE
jgi:lipopolysaccharide assembly outer membrane protein LptD (OstA)